MLTDGTGKAPKHVLAKAVLKNQKQDVSATEGCNEVSCTRTSKQPLQYHYHAAFVTIHSTDPNPRP